MKKPNHENLKESFISLAEASRSSPYSRDYLSFLVRKGKLKARKIGRDWFTTREWVEDYIQRHGRGEDRKSAAFNESIPKKKEKRVLLKTNVLHQVKTGAFQFFLTKLIISIKNLIVISS